MARDQRRRLVQRAALSRGAHGGGVRTGAPPEPGVAPVSPDGAGAPDAVRDSTAETDTVGDVTSIDAALPRTYRSRTEDEGVSMSTTDAPGTTNARSS